MATKSTSLLSRRENPHVVFLPFPAQGHIKPMFILAELLSQADFTVSFVNTHHNHTPFLNLIDQPSFSATFPNFNFYSIPDGLAADHPRKAPFNVDLFRSTSSAACASGFKDLLVSIGNENGESVVRPTCIIADGIMSFAIDVGEELGIPVITFRTYSATCTWVYFHLEKLIQMGEIPVVSDGDMDNQITCIPELETILRRRDLPTMCRGEVENPVLQFFIAQTKKMTRASGLILNTFEDPEAPIVSQLHSIFPKIYTVGPLHALQKSHLIESQPLVPTNGKLKGQDRGCLTWLDSQQSRSVIYVSFGSIVTLTITRDTLLEFWNGLVNSGKPFLWVVRQDLIFDGLFDITDGLDVGTKERGFIVGWAPQEEVLAHEAVGGFLTHSGWNSTLESIWAGVPMVCWPQIADQMVNSRCVSELWRIGVDMKDICDSSTVEKIVRDLMEGKKDQIGESIARISQRARESVVKGGSSFRGLKQLIQDLRSIKC